MPLVNRRVFVGGIAALGTPLRAAPQESDISPNEDLMREHGVLIRCLLIYREAMRRIDAMQQIPAEVIPGTAKLIRDFIENYHEKLEEEQVFPRFRKAGRLVDLVNLLETQHQKGRVLTGEILKSAGRPRDLRRYLEMFVRMYEPHEAREDTVLFPEFRKIVSPKEYQALGDQFEEKENKLFGANGFEKNVSRVAELERALGIYDLAQFTPPV
jgi:hemerythrin-like domain-containing protein